MSKSCSVLYTVLLLYLLTGHVTCGEPDKPKGDSINIEADKKDENLKYADADDHKHHIPHRELSGTNSISGFVWKVIGYLLIIIPASIAIRMARTSNFNEKEGQGNLFRLVQCCVFGRGESATAPSGRLLSPCFSSTSTKVVGLKLAMCTVGLQCSYLTWGVLQEKIMTQKYGEGENAIHFQNSEFLVFMNRIFAFMVAGLYLKVTGTGQWNGPFYRYSFTSLSNICSSWCQYEALKFVSFPTQVLAKASKMIPVMIMGKFVSKKTYQYYEYVVAVTISIGVSLFLTATAGDKHSSTVTTMSGLVLMVGYMGFDSFTSNWQSHLFNEYKISSMQMMFNVNCFSSLFTSVPLIISGGLLYALAFIRDHPEFGTHIFIISLSSVTGQVFIFYTISEFGPLVFTIIMVTRSMFSILLSCVIYGHVLTLQAVIGAVVVFCALWLQVYAKYRINQKKQTVAAANSRGSDMV